MKKVVVFLLVVFIVLNACSSTSHKMKNPRKAHYRTKEGKKKQKHFNQHYGN